MSPMPSPSAFAHSTLPPHRSPRRLHNFTPTCALPPAHTAPLRTPKRRRIPVFGFLIDVIRQRIDLIAFARKYGSVYNTSTMGIPCTVITDLKAVSDGYKDVATFRSSGGYPPSFSAILGENALVLLDGPAHTASRAKYQPAFSPQLFNVYFPVIQTAALSFWEDIRQLLLSKPRLRLEPLVKEYYLCLIMSLTTGSPDNEDLPVPLEQLAQLSMQFKTLNAGLILPPFLPGFRAAMRARAEALETLSVLIKNRMVTRAAVIEALRSEGPEHVTSSARQDLRTGTLDLLTVMCASSPMETGEGVTHDPAELKEVAEGVLNLWSAGYSTQGTSTLNCLMQGWLDDGVLRRLQEEQDEIMQGAGSREVTVGQVKQMKLLDSFLTETLRMYPPAVGSFRKTAREVMVSGHKIPADRLVMLDIWSSQRDRQYYADPDAFVMDRFVSGSSAPTPPSIVAFGGVGGPHYCIGAALAKLCMKTTLATLLREFDLVLDVRQNRGYRSIPEVCPRSGVVALECKKKEANVRSEAT